MVKLKDAADAAGKEETVIGKRLIPVILAPVLIMILCACQAGGNPGNAATAPADTEMTFAQSVLSPARADTERQNDSDTANRHPVKVTLSHAETGMSAQALQALAASFNDENTTGITVELISNAPETEDADMTILDADAFPLAAESAAALDDLIAAGFDNYEDIEKLGKEGPTIESEHKENMAPFSDLKSTSEIGPESSEDPNISKAPMADKELYPDYGGIPIVTKETTRFVESESNESE